MDKINPTAYIKGSLYRIFEIYYVIFPKVLMIGRLLDQTRGSGFEEGSSFLA